MKKARAILGSQGLRPRKRLGQCFLEDEEVIEKIVASADIDATDTIVEIGAGAGVMTEIIAARAGRVIALELDSSLASILRTRFKDHGNVEIIEADVLAYDFHIPACESRTGRVKVIGNIPYYISTQILFSVFAARRDVSLAVMMFQEEVADRIAAPPGSKIYGIPSVIAAMYAQICFVLTVPASCFYPQPKVTSTVLKIVMRERPLVALSDPDFFQKLVRVSFAQRRKTITNNLRKGLLAGHGEGKIAAALAGACIDGRRRGETLSAVEFGALSNSFFSLSDIGGPGGDCKEP